MNEAQKEQIIQSILTRREQGEITSVQDMLLEELQHHSGIGQAASHMEIKNLLTELMLDPRLPIV